MIQIYTGDGKGKTTAALGLALRAAGYGKKTLFIQFMKKQKTGELSSSLYLPGLIKIEQFGRDEFYLPDDKHGNEDIYDAEAKPLGRNGTLKTLSDKALFASDAGKGLKLAEKALSSGRYYIVVLDEIINLISLGIVEEDEILCLVRKYRDSETEIILTGRGASLKLIDESDVVTEMRKIRHPFDSKKSGGSGARKGIDF